MTMKAKKTTDGGKTRKKDDKTHEDYRPSNILKST